MALPSGELHHAVVHPAPDLLNGFDKSAPLSIQWGVNMADQKHMSRFTRSFGYFSLGLGLSLVVGYWLKREEQRQRQASQAPLVVRSAEIPPQPEPTPQAPPPSPPDDLTHIRGVGAKTAEALLALGFQTYPQLAAAQADDLLAKLAHIRGLNREKVQQWIDEAAQLGATPHD